MLKEGYTGQKHLEVRIAIYEYQDAHHDNCSRLSHIVYIQANSRTRDPLTTLGGSEIVVHSAMLDSPTTKDLAQ